MHHFGWSKKNHGIPGVLPKRAPRPLLASQVWDQWKYQPEKVQTLPGVKIGEPGMMFTGKAQAHLTHVQENGQTVPYMVLSPVGV